MGDDERAEAEQLEQAIAALEERVDLGPVSTPTRLRGRSSSRPVLAAAVRGEAFSHDRGWVAGYAMVPTTSSVVVRHTTM